MGYYNKHFEKLDIDEKKLVPLDSGDNARILRYGDMIVKEYLCCAYYTIRRKVFEKLALIDNPHFMRLYDLFTVIYSEEKAAKERADYLSGKNEFEFSGYTAKYYQKSDIHPLEENSSFLLENVEELIELFDLLAKLSIEANDTRVRNSVITEKGIVIVDPDCYRISTDRESEIRKHNYRELCQYLGSLFDNYYRYREKVGDYYRIRGKIDDYFDRLGKHPERGLKEFQKSLTKVSKPRQIIR